MKGVAAYVRVSTEDQAEKFGAEVQEDRIRKWLYAYRDTLWERKIFIENAAFYRDAASGKSDDRPGLASMVEHIKFNETTGLVVVMNVDRLARNSRDAMCFLDDVLAPNGVALASVDQQFDTTTPTGRLVFQMLCNIAEYDGVMLVKRMTNGKKRAVSTRGGAWGGPAPYGYRYTGDGSGGLEVVDDQAEVVRAIFDMSEVGGWPNERILSYLGRNHGPGLSERKISRILARKKFYAGEEGMTPGARPTHPAII